MSILKNVKKGFNVKGVIGVCAGIALFNVVKTKIPQIG